jgi:hypothetical protein
MSSNALSKRGPKTREGKLAVRLNASTHGILSVQPIVNAYESAQDWEDHRQGILDSLSPEGGMEQLLAERVASCSWRLNRILLYESETIAAAQEGVVEAVRQKRKRELEHERIFAKEGQKVLTDIGILIEAHPENVLDDARMARRLHKAVRKLLDSPSATPIEGGDGAWVLGSVAEHAVRLAANQSGKELEYEEVNLLAESLQERLPGIPEDAFLEDVDYRAGQIIELIEWLATEAGVKPEVRTVDSSPISPQEQLIESLRTEARYDLTTKEAKAEAVQAQLLAARRDRKALHELEALQKRRTGGAAPLARVDVQAS